MKEIIKNAIMDEIQTSGIVSIDVSELLLKCQREEVVTTIKGIEDKEEIELFILNEKLVKISKKTYGNLIINGFLKRFYMIHVENVTDVPIDEDHVDSKECPNCESNTKEIMKLKKKIEALENRNQNRQNTKKLRL